MLILNNIHSSSLASASSAYAKQGIQRFEKNQNAVNHSQGKSDHRQYIASPRDIETFQEEQRLAKVGFSANVDNIKTAKALMTYATTRNQSLPISDSSSRLVDIYV